MKKLKYQFHQNMMKMKIKINIGFYLKVCTSTVISSTNYYQSVKKKKTILKSLPLPLI